MYYVYILKINLDEFYIGYTSDLKRRVEQHKRKRIAALIYYEAYILEKTARERERKLKYYGSAWRALKKKNNGFRGRGAR